MKDKIASLIIDLNANLERPIINKTDEEIVDYAEKLTKNATIISILNEDILEAFIAFYDNDLNRQKAYLSMLAVSFTSLGKGYGKSLMQTAIAIVTNKKFTFFDITVDESNTIAVDFALDFGFKRMLVDNSIFYRKEL